MYRAGRIGYVFGRKSGMGHLPLPQRNTDSLVGEILDQNSTPNQNQISNHAFRRVRVRGRHVLLTLFRQPLQGGIPLQIRAANGVPRSTFKLNPLSLAGLLGCWMVRAIRARRCTY